MRTSVRLWLVNSAAIQEGFDYSALADDIAEQARAAAERIKTLLRNHAREVGRELLAVKARLVPGTFALWINDEFGMSLRSAERRMAEARLMAKYDKLSFLPLPVVRAIVRSPEVMHDELVQRAIAGTIATATDVQTAVDDAAAEARSEAERVRQKANEALYAGIREVRIVDHGTRPYIRASSAAVAERQGFVAIREATATRRRLEESDQREQARRAADELLAHPAAVTLFSRYLRLCDEHGCEMMEEALRKVIAT